MNKVIKNVAYQLVYQISRIIIPIITIPIVSRVLGAVNLGIYNYYYSIVSYFILFAGLGITLYGSREIAIVKSDNEKLSQVFIELFIMKALVTSIVLFIFIGSVYHFNTPKYLLLFSIAILSVLFDVSWYFMGVEDFQKFSLINITSQVLVFILIIFFIRDKNDLTLYIIFQSIGLLLPNLISILLLPKGLFTSSVKIRNIFKHFINSLGYFFPQIAITLYTTLNKTIIGLFLDTTSVAYYSNAIVVNSVIITVITTVDTVLLPRMSSLFSQNRKDDMFKWLKNSLNIQLFFSIGAMFGVLSIYNRFVPFFFGEEFIFIIKLIPLLSSLIVIVPVGMSISRQFLLPQGNTKDYFVSIVSGAIINIGLNIFLLPQLGVVGVVLSNIFAELFVTIVRLKPLINEYGLPFNFRDVVVYTLCGISVLGTGFINNFIIHSNFLFIIFQTFVGASIYFLLTYIVGVNPVKKILNKKYG
ncbi:oligosaccharide flippase family protein [Streptococcus suis]|uniref:oligosaccharide flippase family protein n=1 Tax=Streptococcus suis TaxID=1307 RepID=UPI00375713B5